MKPYIFPENQFDEDTVPTPWFERLDEAYGTDRVATIKDRHKALEQVRPSVRRWIAENFHCFDEEDADYVLRMYGWTENPLIKHEAMNFLMIVKLYFTP